MAIAKKEVKKPINIQELCESGDFDGFSVNVFNQFYNVESVYHVKKNVYSVSLARGDEERVVALSGEHRVDAEAQVQVNVNVKDKDEDLETVDFEDERNEPKKTSKVK